MCPYAELFWSLFSRIRTEYGEMRSILPDSVQKWENTDQNNTFHTVIETKSKTCQIHDLGLQSLINIFENFQTSLNVPFTKK